MYDKIHPSLVFSHRTIGNTHPGFTGYHSSEFQLSLLPQNVLGNVGFVKMTDQSQHFHKDIAECAEGNRRVCTAVTDGWLYSPQKMEPLYLVVHTCVGTYLFHEKCH